MTPVITFNIHSPSVPLLNVTLDPDVVAIKGNMIKKSHALSTRCMTEHIWRIVVHQRLKWWMSSNTYLILSLFYIIYSNTNSKTRRSIFEFTRLPNWLFIHFEFLFSINWCIAWVYNGNISRFQSFCAFCVRVCVLCLRLHFHVFFLFFRQFFTSHGVPVHFSVWAGAQLTFHSKACAWKCWRSMVYNYIPS